MATEWITRAPFSAAIAIRRIEDVRQLESMPLEEAVQVGSTYELFRNAAHAFGGAPALTFLRTADPRDEPITWSYATLLEGIHQTANALHSLGVQPTDTIAILLPGCLEYHLALWGGEAAGIVQPLNPMLTDDKLVSLMTEANAKVLIAYGSDVEGELWSKACRIGSRVASLTTVMRVAPHDARASDTADLSDVRGAQSIRFVDFDALRRTQPADALVSGRTIRPADVAAYFHTGGTTGAPKLAVHTHGNQVFTAWASVQLQGASPKHVIINGYPLFHVAGVLPASLASLSAGAHVIIPTTALMRNRDVLRNYWKLVERYRATSLLGVPTTLAALAEIPVDDADISSLNYCRTGAAPLPAELAARFERQFGMHVHESLGMTEMAGISSITPPGVIGPVNCVGFPLPYAKVRIVALDVAAGSPAQDVPCGSTGMVLFKSPNVFKGFLDPADTARAFTPDGWLITGDVGFLDSLGRLNLQGRAKDLIIRGGHNIDPKMIEDALGRHPAVNMCAAVGAPDAYAGELPVAFVTLMPGADTSEAALLAFVGEQVDEAPARPKRVTILPTMPMTNVGKIFKPDLRRLATIQTVQRLIEQVAPEAGIPAPEHCAPFHIIADAQPDVVVQADATVSKEKSALLRQLLDRLPVKVILRDH